MATETLMPSEVLVFCDNDALPRKCPEMLKAERSLGRRTPSVKQGRKSVLIAMVTLPIAAVILSLFFLVPTSPQLRGRPVYEWLDSMRYAQGQFSPGQPESDKSLVTLRTFGPEAVAACSDVLARATEPTRVERFLTGIRNRIRNDRDRNREVLQWTCAAALIVYSGPENGGGLTNLIEAVLQSPIIRPAAANAFFVVGTNHPSIIADLEHGLIDERLEVRQFCIEAIARLEPWAHPLIPAVTNLVNDPDPTIRSYAGGIIRRANLSVGQ